MWLHRFLAAGYWSNTGEDSIYKDWFHIKKESLSPPENLWNSRELSSPCFLPLPGYMPKLNTVIQKWRLSWRWRHTGLKSLILMLGDWTWPMNRSSILARHHKAVILARSRPYSISSEGNLAFVPTMSSMFGWVPCGDELPPLWYQDYSCVGIRRRNALLESANKSVVLWGGLVSEVMFRRSWTRMIQSASWRRQKGSQSVKSTLSLPSICNGNMYLCRRGLALIGGPDGLPPCHALGALVCGQWHAEDFMKDLIQLRRSGRNNPSMARLAWKKLSQM